MERWAAVDMLSDGRVWCGQRREGCREDTLRVSSATATPTAGLPSTREQVCAARAVGYLRPDIRHGGLTNEEATIVYPCTASSAATKRMDIVAGETADVEGQLSLTGFNLYIWALLVM